MNASALIGLSLLHTVALHNIDINNDGWFSPGEVDPYLRIEVLEAEKDARGVLIRYEMSDFPEGFRSELFFETDLHGIEEKFKYPITLKGQKFNQLYIPLDMYEEEELTAIRWDIDECEGCRFKITEISFVESASDQRYDTLIPNSYQPLTFVTQNQLGGNGQDYIIQDFHISGFEHLGGNVLKVKTEDPFIVSPLLDFPLSQLAGVYFRLGVPPTQNGALHFRLGWRTYKFGYRNRTVFRLQNGNDKYIEVFIPFNPLSGEKLLRKFHLRFEPDIGDVWTFETIRLIPFDQMSDYRKFEPAAIANFPGVRSDWANILKGGFRKMVQDKFFFSFYLFVLLAVVYGLYRLTLARRLR